VISGRFLFLNLFNLLTDLASISESRRDAQLWQDIQLEQEPHNENTDDDPYTGHFFSQPPAAMTYAHENPLEGEAQEEGTEPVVPLALIFEEKTDSKRSGFKAPHLMHFIGSLSVKKTICSNSCPHSGHRNSYRGIGNSLCRVTEPHLLLQRLNTNVTSASQKTLIILSSIATPFVGFVRICRY